MADKTNETVPAAAPSKAPPVDAKALIAKLEQLSVELISQYANNTGINIYIYVRQNIKPLIEKLKGQHTAEDVAKAAAFKPVVELTPPGAYQTEPEPPAIALTGVGKRGLMIPKINSKAVGVKV